MYYFALDVMVTSRINEFPEFIPKVNPVEVFFGITDMGCIKSCQVEIDCGNFFVKISGLKFSFPPHKHWCVSIDKTGQLL